MSDDASAERLAVVRSPEARDDLRAIDRETAMRILYCVDRYLFSRFGDVNKHKPPRTDFRLRCGDYRLFFEAKAHNVIEVTGVRNRKDAYQ